MNNQEEQLLAGKNPENDIMSDRPGFIARWSFVIFAFIFVIVLSVAWFIRFPDVIKAKATIVQASEEEGGLFAVIRLPKKYNNKVGKGQVVQIRLNEYKYEDFGYISGVLQQVSGFAADSSMIWKIQLPQGLRTNRQKQLQFSSDLNAEALIFTGDVRLLVRVFRKMLPEKEQ
jgi:hypothetical protein